MIFTSADEHTAEQLVADRHLHDDEYQDHVNDFDHTMDAAEMPCA